MQTREYRTLDKSAWGDGPWQAEFDKKQWQDEATGFPCLIVRNPHSGSLCGYVGVPHAHLTYGADYGDLDISVHGGLTFGGACRHNEDESRGICHVPGPDEPDDVWWFGFDCAHAFDLVPFYRARYPEWPDNSEIYRTVEYVAGECASLAAQLAVLVLR